MYYIPKTKKELVKWLFNYYGHSKTRFVKMSKKQLYAVYHKIRKSLI